MAVTFRATFFGPHGLWNNPSGAWMPGKVIGFNWTNVLSLLRWELNTSSMPSALTHKGLGEQQHAKLWAFLPAMLQRTPILNICMGISLRLPQGTYQLNGRHLLTRVESMVASEESGSEAESGWSGVSNNSSTDLECTILEALSVEAFRELAEGLYNIDLTRYSRGVTSEDAPGVQLLNGQEKLQELVHLPRTWPLARLTIPLAGLSKQIDRLLEGYCFQILATNRDPETHNGKVIQTATHLTWILAEYVADTIAWLMRSILDHASKILFDNDTQPLLTPSFWILPLYRELLNSARRIRPSAASERARGCTGLVKLICKENKEQRGKRKFHAGTPHPNDRGGFTQWFGSCSLISTLYVWFPASWAPMVAERLCPIQGGHPIHSVVSLLQGLPRRTPEHILGTNMVMALLVPVGQWRMLTALKWYTKSGNGHCLVLQSCRCSTLAAEFSGLNWMIKLSWTAILCYGRAFSVMCFRRSAQLRGRALVGKGLRLPSCCRAVKMRMTGSISCWRKRTYGPPLQPGVLSQRRSPNRSFVRSGAGCRPSMACACRPNVHQGHDWEVQRRTRCSAF